MEQVPAKNIPAIGAAPSKLAGTLVYHPCTIENSRAFNSADIEFTAAWARRVGSLGGLSCDECADIQMEALHAIASASGNQQPSHEVIRNCVDLLVASRSASLFTRREHFAALEEAWVTLRKSLETREVWVLTVKERINDSVAVKDLKAAAAAATAAAGALGPKGVYQAVRWHYLHGQTGAKELQLLQSRDAHQQQVMHHQKEQQRLLAMRLAIPKYKHTPYAKRPAAFKAVRQSSSHKKTPPVPKAPAISCGGGSDSDILEIPSPPTPAPPPSAKRPSTALKVSPFKKSALVYAHPYYVQRSCVVFAAFL